MNATEDDLGILRPDDPGFPDWANGVETSSGQRFGQYLAVRPTPCDGQWLALMPMIYTYRVAIADQGGYSEFWEYKGEDMASAYVAFLSWPDMTGPLACDWTRHSTPDGPMERQYNTSHATGGQSFT